MSENRPKLGVLLPTRGLLMTGDRPQNADSVIALAERAEEAGLDSVWMGDSLTAKPRLEPITALAAVAARTKCVRLGTAVLLAGLRHPVLLSHAVGTLDLIAGGRTVLAIGVGGAFNAEQREEWAAAGVDTVGRASRLEELVRITKGLTSGEEVTHDGRHFQLEAVRRGPVPARRGVFPFCWVATGGRAGRGSSRGLRSWATGSSPSRTRRRSSPWCPIRCAIMRGSMGGTSIAWNRPIT